MSYAYDSNFEDVLTAPKPEPKARLHGPHRIQNIQCVVNPWPALGNAPGIYDPSSGLFITDFLRCRNCSRLVTGPRRGSPAC